MKTSFPHALLLALLLAASSVLASCVSSNDQSANPDQMTGNGYETHVFLPSNFAGDAYYHNNRYYAGGRYESGEYSDGGRTYDHRYFHDGQYLYGGDYRQPAFAASAQRATHRSAPAYRATTRQVSY